MSIDRALASGLCAWVERSLETTGVTRAAFRKAVSSAILAIAAELWPLWRNWRDPLLVLPAPLSLQRKQSVPD